MVRFGVLTPSFFHCDPGLWGGVPWADLRSHNSWQRGPVLLVCPQHNLHKLWARACAERWGSEGKAGVPPRGAHLRGTDRHHQDRECGEAPEFAAMNLPRKPRGARTRGADIQSSILEKLSGWPAGAPGTGIPPHTHTPPPPASGPGPRPHPPDAVLSTDQKGAIRHLQKPERKAPRLGAKDIKWDSSQPCWTAYYLPFPSTPHLVEGCQHP